MGTETAAGTGPVAGTNTVAGTEPGPATGAGGRWADQVAAVVGPTVAGRHQEIDRLGHLPADVVEAMHRSGAFRTWVPAELGGRGATLAEGLELIEALSELDSALGWITMINITSTWLAGSIEREAAAAIFADPRAVLGGTTAPSGRAEPAPGGITLTGRWSWGSGIHNADWMACGAMLSDGTGSAPRPIIAVVPIAEIDVLDTWHVSGMKGTGSTDYRTEAVFVPDGRVLDLTRRPPWSTAQLHRFAVFGLLALAVSSVAVGLGRRALAEFRLLASERTLLGSRSTLASSPVAQTAYAQAEAAVLSAAALKDTTVAAAWAEAAGGSVARETRRLLRLAATNAAATNARAIDQLWEHAGASVVYDDHPLQRLQRDVHVLTQHFRVATRTWEMCGALALGQPFDGQL